MEVDNKKKKSGQIGESTSKKKKAGQILAQPTKLHVAAQYGKYDEVEDLLTRGWRPKYGLTLSPDGFCRTV